MRSLASTLSARPSSKFYTRFREPRQLTCVCYRAFGKINHIVNNAGFTYDGMIHKTSDKQWEVMLNVHQTAPFRIIRAAAPYLRKKDGENKAIVNVSPILLILAFIYPAMMILDLLHLGSPRQRRPGQLRHC